MLLQRIGHRAAVGGLGEAVGCQRGFVEVVAQGPFGVVGPALDLGTLQQATDQYLLVDVQGDDGVELLTEAEYRSLYARNLTLNRLSEAVILPLYPDKGGCMTYDLSRTASTYLEEDIELLKRVRPAE